MRVNVEPVYIGPLMEYVAKFAKNWRTSYDFDQDNFTFVVSQ
jgi:hypothetical protein